MSNCHINPPEHITGTDLFLYMPSGSSLNVLNSIPLQPMYPAQSCPQQPQPYPLTSVTTRHAISSLVTTDAVTDVMVTVSSLLLPSTYCSSNLNYMIDSLTLAAFPFPSSTSRSILYLVTNHPTPSFTLSMVLHSPSAAGPLNYSTRPPTLLPVPCSSYPWVTLPFVRQTRHDSDNSNAPWITCFAGFPRHRRHNRKCSCAIRT